MAVRLALSCLSLMILNVSLQSVSAEHEIYKPYKYHRSTTDVGLNLQRECRTHFLDKTKNVAVLFKFLGL